MGPRVEMLYMSELEDVMLLKVDLKKDEKLQKDIDKQYAMLVKLPQHSIMTMLSSSNPSLINPRSETQALILLMALRRMHKEGKLNKDNTALLIKRCSNFVSNTI
jgi:hypothetical protein